MREFRGFHNGVNLGGWISQFERYDEGHFNSFITKKDIESIADMGFDHVRVPVDYNVLEDEEGNPRESGYNYLHACREWCAGYGLNMLIDLHECFGYSFDPLKKDMDRRKFFFDKDLQDRFLRLWKRIASEFRDHTDRVAFEPLNEVVPRDVAKEWNELLKRYIELMRSVVPEAYLVAGGVCYNNVLSVPLLDVPVDPYIVYNFHCYEPMIFTHQGAYWVEGMPEDFRIQYPGTLEEYRAVSHSLEADLAGAVDKEGISEIGPGFFEDIIRVAVDKAEADGAALYCGEYGVIELADNDSSLKWMQDIKAAFDKFGIGHALWNYKGKDFGLADERNAGIREGLLRLMQL